MHKYTLNEYYDPDKENPIEMEFKKRLKEDQKFDVDDVTYKVIELDSVNYKNKEFFSEAIVKMVRYRIPDTATQFVHKCPVKKTAAERLDSDDVIKIMKKYGEVKGKKRILSMQEGRAKMNSHNKMKFSKKQKENTHRQ
jgi:hypothetical protein